MTISHFIPWKIKTSYSVTILISQPLLTGMYQVVKGTNIYFIVGWIGGLGAGMLPILEGCRGLCGEC